LLLGQDLAKLVASKKIVVALPAGTQDPRGNGLKALGGFCTDGFDLPVDKNDYPQNRKQDS